MRSDGNNQYACAVELFYAVKYFICWASCCVKGACLRKKEEFMSSDGMLAAARQSAPIFNAASLVSKYTVAQYKSENYE